MFPIWHITLQRFIRKSFLSLEESSQTLLLGINPAVMRCTSLTQSLNSGTSPLWRGTDLCLGLGQCCFKKATVHLFSLSSSPQNNIEMFVLNSHSATLLSQRLIIFGGRKTATYLNDIHALDLGKMRTKKLHYGKCLCCTELLLLCTKDSWSTQPWNVVTCHRCLEGES